MRSMLLVTFIAAPMIVLGGVALSHPHPGAPLPLTDTISINPKMCIVYIDGSGGIAAEGRVFVKFDVKRPPLTVDGNCTVTAFEEDTQDEPLAEEDFDCFVQITAPAGHFHQILYWDAPGVSNKKRFRNGKAKLSCSGPYDRDQPLEYEP